MGGKGILFGWTARRPQENVDQTLIHGRKLFSLLITYSNSRLANRIELFFVGYQVHNKGMSKIFQNMEEVVLVVVIPIVTLVWLVIWSYFFDR